MKIVMDLHPTDFSLLFQIPKSNRRSKVVLTTGWKSMTGETVFPEKLFTTTTRSRTHLYLKAFRWMRMVYMSITGPMWVRSLTVAGNFRDGINGAADFRLMVLSPSWSPL